MSLFRSEDVLSLNFPSHRWADVVPTQHEELFIESSGCSHGPPTVQMRGIFLNDEQVRRHIFYCKRVTNRSFNSRLCRLPFHCKKSTNRCSRLLRTNWAQEKFTNSPGLFMSNGPTGTNNPANLTGSPFIVQFYSKL